jgi:hypothetical protein
MRELKFRVWYDKSQCWIYFNLNKGFTDFGLKLYRELIVNGAKFYQFTGLKDKNGKDIYFDDLVQAPSGFCLKVSWIDLEMRIALLDSNNFVYNFNVALYEVVEANDIPKDKIL